MNKTLTTPLVNRNSVGNHPHGLLEVTDQTGQQNHIISKRENHFTKVGYSELLSSAISSQNLPLSDLQIFPLREYILTKNDGVKDSLILEIVTKYGGCYFETSDGNCR